MSLNKLGLKYISSAEKVLSQMQIAETRTTVDSAQVRSVVDFAIAYLEDARFYREKKKFEVSLTSIAYCEGLLDALRLLGVVKFEWPRRENKRRPKGK